MNFDDFNRLVIGGMDISRLYGRDGALLWFDQLNLWSGSENVTSIAPNNTVTSSAVSLAALNSVAGIKVTGTSTEDWNNNSVSDKSMTLTRNGNDYTCLIPTATLLKGCSFSVEQKRGLFGAQRVSHAITLSYANNQITAKMTTAGGILLVIASWTITGITTYR